MKMKLKFYQVDKMKCFYVIAKKMKFDFNGRKTLHALNQ